MDGKSKLLDEGSYGCAFIPQLPCKKSKSNKKLVGKIISKNHADVELSIASIVKGIPGWQRYFIVQEEDNCDSKNFEKARKEYNNCKVLHKTNTKNLTQLISVFGGTTMNRMSLSSFDYLGSFRHMLEGIVKLEEQGICHYDLKENNILIDSNGTLRIIDFGSAFVGDQVEHTNLWLHQYDFIPEYVPQPPEPSVQNGLYDEIPIETAIRDTIHRKKIFKIIENILGISMQRSENELRTFWEDEDREWVSFFRNYWRTWDSWAIGVIFIKLLQTSLLNKSFIERVWVPHGAIIRNVLKGMLRVNPHDRLSGSQALKLLTFSLA